MSGRIPSPTCEPPVSRLLQRIWIWLHDEVGDAPHRDDSSGLLVAVGVVVCLLGWMHLNLEVRRAPLVRGFWRGEAFLGGSMAGVVLWEVLRREKRAAQHVLLGLMGTFLVALPTLVRLHPDMALRANAPLWLGLGAVGIGLTWLTGRRAGVDWASWGLSLGDWRWWGPRAAVLSALIVVGTGVAMMVDPELREFYPWQSVARTDPEMFKQVQAAVFLDFIGWEYLHRGFLLFALARRGDVRMAIWTQAFIFFLLHQGKPDLEMMLSLPGGVIAGYFSWRARSFAPLWLLHSIQLATTNQVAMMLRGLG